MALSDDEALLMSMDDIIKDVESVIEPKPKPPEEKVASKSSVPSKKAPRSIKPAPQDVLLQAPKTPTEEPSTGTTATPVAKKSADPVRVEKFRRADWLLDKAPWKRSKGDLPPPPKGEASSSSQSCPPFKGPPPIVKPPEKSFVKPPEKKKPLVKPPEPKPVKMSIVPPPPPAVKHSQRTDTPWKAKRIHRGGKANEHAIWWKAYLKAKAQGSDAEQFFLRVFEKPKPSPKPPSKA